MNIWAQLQMPAAVGRNWLLVVHECRAAAEYEPVSVAFVFCFKGVSSID